MPFTSPPLLTVLRQLLLPEQVQEAERLAQTQTPEAMVQALTQQGALTTYQAEELSAGRGPALILDKYVLLDKLGEGGMGQVFRARHAYTRREVALKRILSQQLGSSDAVKRFLREVEAATHLSHPNIVQVFDAGESSGAHYLTMELVRGVNLAGYLEDQGQLPVAEAVDYVRQACEGMQHAHEMGVVHRDLKPANLMVTREGQVKILDLGLALMLHAPTLTRSGGYFGTVDYMAPEQVKDSHNVDIRADVYSLGCTLYHLLAGKTPYAHAPQPVRAFMHGREAPPPLESLRLDVSPQLANVVRTMMAATPEQRYQTPGQAAEALAAIQSGSGGESQFWLGMAGVAAGRNRPTPAVPPTMALAGSPLTAPTKEEKGPLMATTVVPGSRQAGGGGGGGGSTRLVLAGLLGGLLGLVGIAALLLPLILRDSRDDAYRAAMKKADEAMTAKDYPAARQAYGDALRNKPDDPDATKGDRDAAAAQEQAYQEAMKKAELARTAKKYHEARLASSEALKHKPDDLDAVRGHQEAIVLQEAAYQEAMKRVEAAKDHDAAIEAYDQALTHKPDDPAASKGRTAAVRERSYLAQMKKAETAMKQEQYAAAAAAYQQALVHKPGDPAAAEGRKKAISEGAYQAAMDKAERATKANKYVEAVAAYEEALKHKPGDLTATEKRKNAVAERSYALAMEEARQAMEAKQYAAAVDAYDRALIYKQGDVAATEGRAIALVEKLYLLAMQKAESCMQKKDYVGARDAYDEALTQKPKDAAAATGRAIADREVRYQTAMKSAERATKERKYAEAIAAYDEALKLKPADSAATEGKKQAIALRKGAYDAAMKKGEQALEAEKYEEARLAFEEALRLVPKDRKATAGLERATDVVTDVIGMKLVRVKAGKFTMGSPRGEKDRPKGKLDDEKQRVVVIEKDFRLGKFEVTQGQFRKVMGYNPSHFSKDGKGVEDVEYTSPPAGGKDKVKGENTDDFPVENVSWKEAQAFVKKLNGLAVQKKEKLRYRLPTEAEWEYACRGGHKIATLGDQAELPFHFAKPTDEIDTDRANFAQKLDRTSKVGSYAANALGICDMHGNVEEWCQDDYDGKGKTRVVRGGSWRFGSSPCRAAARGSFSEDYRRSPVGFRIVAE